VEPVFPTPTIGMIGLIEDKKYITPLGFQTEGDVVYLIGKHSAEINSSQYLGDHFGIKLSPAPHFSFDEEITVQEAVAQLIRKGLLASAHDVADGGLFL